jgi:hypothetical protein
MICTSIPEVFLKVNRVTDSPDGVCPKGLEENNGIGLFGFCEKLRKEK